MRELSTPVGLVGAARPCVQGPQAGEVSSVGAASAHNTGRTGAEAPDDRHAPVATPPSATAQATAPDTVVAVPAPDPVNRPRHYTAHRSGVECIEISEHLCANLAQALQYVWRAPYKGHMAEDLAKARWFIVRECARRNKLTGSFLPTLDRDLHSRFMRAMNAEGQSTFGEFLNHVRRAHYGPSYDCDALHCALDELTIMVSSARWWA